MYTLCPNFSFLCEATCINKTVWFGYGISVVGKAYQWAKIIVTIIPVNVEVTLNTLNHCLGKLALFIFL